MGSQIDNDFGSSWKVRGHTKPKNQNGEQYVCGSYPQKNQHKDDMALSRSRNSLDYCRSHKNFFRSRPDSRWRRRDCEDMGCRLPYEKSGSCHCGSLRVCKKSPICRHDSDYSRFLHYGEQHLHSCSRLFWIYVLLHPLQEKGGEYQAKKPFW